MFPTFQDIFVHLQICKHNKIKKQKVTAWDFYEEVILHDKLLLFSRTHTPANVSHYIRTVLNEIKLHHILTNAISVFVNLYFRQKV